MRPAVTTAKPPAAGSVAAPPHPCGRCHSNDRGATRQPGDGPLHRAVDGRSVHRQVRSSHRGRRHAEPSYSKGDGRDGRRGGLSHG